MTVHRLPASTMSQAVRQALPVAVELVQAVHDSDLSDVLCALDRTDTDLLCLVLAAMLDDDRSVRSLLRDLPALVSRLNGPRPRKPRNLRPCGTHAAYVRHRAAGQDPCEPCVHAERAYQRARPRDRRVAS